MTSLKGKNIPVFRPRRINLAQHHALCELNFHRLLRLLPGLRSGCENWRFVAGECGGEMAITVHVKEVAPYTTTVQVEQSHKAMNLPTMSVRLYHDVGMAEIIAWDRHRHWLPHYEYPNKNMYHPDEKIALNQFLSDWLAFFRSHGYANNQKCEAVLSKSR